MRFLAFVSILFFCQTAYADLYVGEKENGKTAQLNYISGSDDSLELVAKEHGFKAGSLVRVEEKDLPTEEIKYWTINNGVIVVDSDKKQLDDEAKQAAKEARKTAKQSVLSKLGINKEELRILLEAE